MLWHWRGGRYIGIAFMKNIFWLFINFFLLLPTNVFGIETGGGDSPTSPFLPNPLGKNTTISSFIAKILEIVIYIGGIVAVFFIIYSGFLFVMARGNEDKLKGAKQTILYTVIGVAILLGAVVIQTIIKGTLVELDVIKP